MPDMTLQEALQTDEVQGYLGRLIEAQVEKLDFTPDESAIADAVKAAVEKALPDALSAALPQLRESVREEIEKDSELERLHTEATRLIESAKLPAAAKQHLLQDYGLTEADDGKLQPGRGLALIEAVVDDKGAVTKSAKKVLAEAIDADAQRQRLLLRESAPSVPWAPGGGGGGEEPAAAGVFGGEESAWAQRMREKGMDPARFGATPIPTPAS